LSTITGLSPFISLTTTGSSGTSTLSSGVLNVPTYTLSGLGGQPLSTNLTSISGLTYASTSFVKMTGAGTFALDTNTYYLSSNPSGFTSNTGTVTTASVVSANGFAGTVANASTTPAITLSTSVTGLLKGNGTAISAASAGTDYQAPITLTTTGTTGAATLLGSTLNIPQYSGASGGGAFVPLSGTTDAAPITGRLRTTNNYGVWKQFDPSVGTASSLTTGLITGNANVPIAPGNGYLSQGVHIGNFFSSGGIDYSQSILQANAQDFDGGNITSKIYAQATNQSGVFTASVIVDSTSDNTRLIINNNGGFPNTGLELQGNNVAKWSVAAFNATQDFSIYNNTLGSDALVIKTNTSNVLIGTTTDVASSKLTIDSTTQGVLIPRMTTVNRNAITSPATGLQIYNTNTNANQFWNGSAWLTPMVTLTTTGTTGAAIFNQSTGALNIPQYSGGSGGSSTTFTNQSFTATSGQTVFTISGGYTPGLIVVFYNGSKLATSEYTASNGTTVVLGFAAELNDIIDVDIFTTSDVLTAKAFTTITYSGTPNWDYGTGYNKQITLSGAATLSITNDSDGDYGVLFVTQDGVGGRILTLPVGDNTTGLSVQTTANSIVIYSYVKKGAIRYWNASNR
jgi:hypothetical protein